MTMESPEDAEDLDDDFPEADETVPLGKSDDGEDAETLEDATDGLEQLRESADDTTDLPLSED